MASRPCLGSSGKLPRTRRVTQRQDFLRIQRKGIRVQTDGFAVIAIRGVTHPRLGTAVSRRTGNAVARNRIRRLLREVFRRLAPELPPIDLVIVAKEKAAELAKDGFDVVATDVVPAIKEAASRIGRQVRGSGETSAEQQGGRGRHREGTQPPRPSRGKPSGS